MKHDKCYKFITVDIHGIVGVRDVGPSINSHEQTQLTLYLRETPINTSRNRAGPDQAVLVRVAHGNMNRYDPTLVD